MTGTVTKGLALRGDLDLYDGTLAGSRTDSTGGTTSGLRIGDLVDVLSVFGAGDTANQTRATLATATGALGSANVGLALAPGVWAIDDDLTIAANFSIFLPPGGVFNVSAGKTLTIAGVFYRAHGTFSSGSGAVTISGTDVLGGVGSGNTAEYAVDTGASDVYVINPSPTVASYAAGQMFRFRVANGNSGASTLNVSGLGAKAIVQADGATALATGNLTTGQIVTVSYESVGDEFHLTPTEQPVANPAKTDANNVYSKTETWKLGADVTSATALAVNIDGNIFDITGTTTVTSLATKGVGTIAVLQFDSALILTHHASNLVLPDAQNITTAAGDIAVLYEYASGDWRLLSFQRATLGGYTTVVKTYAAGSHTWSKPANLISIVVEAQGGGGGGGGTANPGTTEAGAGAGGGGGGYARKMLLAAALGSSESVTVGAVAAGGSSSNGIIGNASTFAVASGTNIVGNGGGAGKSATGAVGVRVEAGAVGGAATGGDINITGSGTGPAFSMGNDSWGDTGTQALAFSSPGGSGFFGGGGGSSSATETTTTSGGAGTNGGGGGGSSAGDGGGAVTGGAGGAGLVVVTELIKAI